MNRREAILKGYWTETFTYKDRVVDTFGDNLPKINNGFILDAGCSRGDTTQELAKYYADSKILGVDCDDFIFYLTNGKSSNLVDFVKADFLSEEFSQEYIAKFNAVFAMNNFFFSAKTYSSDILKSKSHLLGSLVKNKGYLAISGTFQGIHDYGLILQKNRNKFTLVHRSFDESKEEQVNMHNKLMSSFNL